MGLAQLVWAFEVEATDSQAHAHARQQIEKMLGDFIPAEFKDKITLKVKAQRCAERVSKRARVSDGFKPEDILPYCTITESFNKYPGNDGEMYQVNMGSKRYVCFQRDGCKCQACGLVGTVMYMERDRSTKEGRAHFNLYGVENGQEVLFTKDHILARAAGGKDDMANLQTYCSICNMLKGKHDATNEQIAELRKVHDQNKDHKVRKAVVIRETKMGIGAEKGFGKKKNRIINATAAKEMATRPRLLTNCTIAVMDATQNGNKLLLGHAWANMKAKTQAKAIKVIPPGTLLQVNRSASSSVVCFIDEEGTKVHIPFQYLEIPDGEGEGEDVRGEGSGSNGVGEAVEEEGRGDRSELGRRTESVVSSAGLDGSRVDGLPEHGG